jgi:RimJ/RimL family protein N-acetyltransferase
MGVCMNGDLGFPDGGRSSRPITAEYLAHHPRAFDVRLRDGRRVRIRPLVPGDREEIARALDRMSSQSLYFRFHRVVKRLSDAELQYLADVDQERHVAWGAIALDEPARPGIGVARFVRDADDPSRAQVAIGIIDAYHRAGLGRVLLQTLLVTAAQVGVQTLVADVLSANVAALRLFQAAGAELDADCAEVCRVEIPVTGARRTYRWSKQIRLSSIESDLGLSSQPDRREERQP